MAQLVERVLGKDEVTGSNPVSSSTKEVDFDQLLFFFRLINPINSYIKRKRINNFVGSLFFDLFI